MSFDREGSFEDGDTSDGEILEVRGNVRCIATRSSHQPLVFFTEDGEVDAAAAFLEVLVKRVNNGRVRLGTRAEIGFLDVALPADGHEVALLVSESRPVEPWVIAQLIYEHWKSERSPLLRDLPNWFYLEEGIVSVTHLEPKWKIDIRPVQQAELPEGSRVLIAF